MCTCRYRIFSTSPRHQSTQSRTLANLSQSPPVPRNLPLLRLLDNHRRSAPIAHKTARVRRSRRRDTRHRVIANSVIRSENELDVTAAARGAMSCGGSSSPAGDPADIRRNSRSSPRASHSSTMMPAPRNLNQRHGPRPIRPHRPFPTSTPTPVTVTTAARCGVAVQHAALEHCEELFEAGERTGHGGEVGREGCCYCYRDAGVD